MITLKMDLVPHGDESKTKPGIAWATIVNDGTGDEDTGNYDVTLYNGRRKWKDVRVEGFPRKKLKAWDILYRALDKACGKRNSV